MSCSNSILTGKTSVGKICKSKSFSEEHVSSSKSIMNEKREILKNKGLPKEGEHVVDIEISPLVFRVPKSLSETKPEAYGPQKLGLGPFHHFRLDLYAMQRKKFSDVLEFMDADEEEGPKNIRRVLLRLSGQQNLLRGSYNRSLNLDHVALVRIMAIDTIYLLNYLDHHHQEDINTAPEMKILAGDILMLENQTPGDLLLEIWRILKRGDDHVLSKNILAFCEKESPLKILTKKPDDVLPLMRQGHLLNVLYNLILQREIKTDGLIRRRRTDAKAKRKEEIAEEIRIHGAAKIAARHGGGAGSSKGGSKGSEDSEPPAYPHVDLEGLAEAVSGVRLQGVAIINKELSIMQKLPWTDFLNKLKKIDPNREENSSSVGEIRIPSVSLLSGSAQISFDVAKKGIRDIKFNKNTRTLSLPALNLHSNSEVILRNLLAYEAAITKPGSTLEFAEYVDLMCSIVDTPEDVRTLRQAAIIDGDIKSAEIVQIFNGIRRSTVYDDENEDKDISIIGKAIKDVKKYYSSRPNVMVRRWFTKRIYDSWKLFAIFSSAMIVMLLALQAFCEIYDCNKHLSLTNNYNPSGY